MKKYCTGLLLLSLVFTSCEWREKTIKDYPNTRWSLNSEDISFYFDFHRSFYSGDRGELTYSGHTYNLFYVCNPYKKYIKFFDFDKINENENRILSEFLLFNGDIHIKNEICYITIKDDFVFNGSITEMQLTYSSLD